MNKYPIDRWKSKRAFHGLTHDDETGGGWWGKMVVEILTQLRANMVILEI